MDIRNYLMNFLATKGPGLQPFAVTAVVQLLCRITKYAWFDEADAVRQIVPETRRFLTATVRHCVIGMRIFYELVNEMNYKNRNRTLTQVSGWEGEGAGPGAARAGNWVPG
jgi:exportin-7